MSSPTEQPDPEALEREVAQLRERNAALEDSHKKPPGHRAGRIARSTGAVILIVLGVLCLVVAPMAVWGRNLLLNTDRYVETLKPVASNPGMQDAVIRAVDTQVTDHLDVKGLVTDVLPPRAAQALAGPLESAVTGLVNTVTTRFVQSDAFQKLWETVNRLAHEDIVYVLTGHRPAGSALTFTHGKIQLDLSVVVQKVRDKLVAAGLTVAQNIPVAGATIEIANLKGVDTARRATRALNNIANWLPWIGLALTAGGVALARKRRRALISAALGLCAGMLVIGIGLLVARNIFLGSVPTDRLPRDTAQFLFDTIVRFLRLGIRIVFLLALLIAFGAWVSGRSRAATAMRHAAASVPSRLGGEITTGPVGPFVVRYTTALRVGAVGFGLIVLFLIDGPSLGTIILLAVLVLVLLTAIEVIRASERQADRQAPVAG